MRGRGMSGVSGILTRWFACGNAGWLLALLVAVLSGCGGGGSSSSSETPPPPTSVTDTSGDFAITVRADSATQLTVTWDDPTATYAAQPLSRYSIVYRDGVKIVPSTAGFSFIDTGLQPDTPHCYRVEVIATYQVLWGVQTIGWSSGTACIATLYGLRVVASSPAAGEVSVAPDSVISVTFNGTIDPASVTSTAFRMSDASGDVAGSLTVDGNTIRFRPETALVWGTTYAVTVAGVRDTAGFTLPTPYSWTFTQRMSVACLKGLWGSSADDIVAVADDGAVLRFDGNAWAVQRAADGNALNAVWGSGPDNVYAVGADRILRDDGAAWTEAWNAGGAQVSLNAVWGSSASDVFAVGAGGVILHFDGTSWSTMTSGVTAALTGVWGTAANNVFAVGIGGTVLHYDGVAWTPMNTGVGTDLFAVWGSSARDVIAAGRNYDEPNVLYYDGSNWSADPVRYNDITALGGVPGGQAYATSLRDVLVRAPSFLSGYVWNAVYFGNEVSPTLLSVWANATDNVYVGGCSGRILHYDGSGWSAVLP